MYMVARRRVWHARLSIHFIMKARLSAKQRSFRLPIGFMLGTLDRLELVTQMGREPLVLFSHYAVSVCTRYLGQAGVWEAAAGRVPVQERIS